MLVRISVLNLVTSLLISLLCPSMGNAIRYYEPGTPEYIALHRQPANPENGNQGYANQGFGNQGYGANVAEMANNLRWPAVDVLDKAYAVTREVTFLRMREKLERVYFRIGETFNWNGALERQLCYGRDRTSSGNDRYYGISVMYICGVPGLDSILHEAGHLAGLDECAADRALIEAEYFGNGRIVTGSYIDACPGNQIRVGVLRQLQEGVIYEGSPQNETSVIQVKNTDNDNTAPATTNEDTGQSVQRPSLPPMPPSTSSGESTQLVNHI